jgi:hypothetical protein
MLKEFAETLTAQALILKEYVVSLVAGGGTALPPSASQLTALASAVVAIAVVVLLTSPRLRKFVLDALETVLAIALIAILLAVVIGLPLGTCRPLSFFGCVRALMPRTHFTCT